MTRRLAMALALVATVPAGALAQPHVAPVEMRRDVLPSDAQPNRVETVNADLAHTIGTWRGVRSCGEARRAADALRSAFDRWIGQQTIARPGRLLITYGWGSNSVWVENRTRHGVRSCKGGFRTAPVYARFY